MARMVRIVVPAMAAALFASGCGPAAPAASFACTDCGRADLLVGEPVEVRASWSGDSLAVVEVGCNLPCDVEAGTVDPDVTLVTSRVPGLLRLAVMITNARTGVTERYAPPAVEVHAPESLEVHCPVPGAEGSFAPCGTHPLEQDRSPYVVVLARRGSTTRALYRPVVNGRNVRALRDPSGKVAWMLRYMNFARPEEKAEELKGWSLRPGPHQIRAEAGGASVEATVEVR